MRAIPMEVTLRLSPRQLQLLADARDRRAPACSLEAFVALAVAEDDPAEAPPAVAPRPASEAPGLVEPGRAAAIELRRGDVVQIEQIQGGQCVDLVAWSRTDRRERLSAARTRSIAGVSPGLGDALWSAPPYERPLLVLIEDSSPGHDLLFPACSAREYAVAGCLPEPSCVAVQSAAAAAWGLETADLPDPLNLWLRAELADDGRLGWHSTRTAPGDRVSLLALAPLLVIVNPCVDDVFGCSGLEPRPVAVTAREASAAEQARWLAAPAATPAIQVTGRARPLARGAASPAPTPAAWQQLAVTLPDGTLDARGARAAAVRVSLAILAGGR